MTNLRPACLVDRLRDYALRAPDRVAFTGTGRPLTRGEWDREARSVAADLRPGDRVLVLLPSDVDFFVAFAGVLYAGATAVPVPYDARGRFAEIARDADVSTVITTSTIASMAAEHLPAARWVELDRLSPAEFEPVAAAPDDLALLLYTSGSTGTPKGVAVRHRVLAAWLDVFGERVDLPAGSSVVTWVTAHHVLGLCLALMGMWLDGPVTLLAAGDVLADPASWLRAISAAPAPVLSGAPPFAYQQCVDQIPPDCRTGLDLSGWDVAVIGSERISPAVLDDFTTAFAPYGFRASAFFPGYGTTETMMAAAHRGPAEPVRVRVDAASLERHVVRPAGSGRAVELVACGSPGRGIETVVVDPDTRRPVGPGRVGELWLRGEPIADGYWRRPDDCFDARLADGTGPYLRSGDLAFRHDDELVLCGRIRELIIVRGRNLAPEAVEATARAADPALAGVPVAAFAVAEQRGDQLLVLLTGTDDGAAELARRVRTAIIAAHEVEPHAVHVVPPDAIPLTTTGKVRRAACRTALLAGTLPIIASAPGAEPARPADKRDSAGAVAGTAVRRRIGAVLGEPWQSVPVDRPLIQLGLDSMRMIRLRADLDAELGVLVPLDLLAGHTVRSLADELAKPGRTPAAATRAPVVSVTPDPAHRHDPFPLTELQHAYLVGRAGGYQLSGVGTHFYAEFDTADLDLDRLHTAWCRLVERHDMLRAVVSADGEQRVAPSVDVPPLVIGDDTERTRAELSHQVFPADDWPLFDIRADRRPGGTYRVAVSLDLLVLDVWSLHIISREWRRLYREPDRELPPLSLTFRDCVLADRPEDDEARRYWQDRLDTLPTGPELPLRTAPAGPPTFHRRAGRIEEADWRRLTDRAATHGLTPTSVLLAAYATVLARWSRHSRFLLNLPTFNRRPIHPEIGAIVGDFTSVTLLEIDLTGAGSLVDVAARVQSRLWQDLDHHGYDGVRVLRDLARHRDQDSTLLAPVVFSSASGQSTDHGADGADEMPLAWLGEQVFGVSQTPQVLLDHQVIEHDGGLTYQWDSVDGMFADGVVDDMFAAHQALLAGLVAGTAWDETPLVPLPEAQARLIAAVNDTDGPLPDELLHAGIAAQVRRAPDRIAVIAGDRSLTYQQLWRHAAAVARQLEPNELVAVSLPKGAEQIVAVLGVLLAGAAYLPIDPALPEARRRRLLELGRCRRVVDSVDLSGPAPDVDPPSSAASPDDLAYVIFTSGSTGEPKGVAVSHRAARNTCVDICERFDVGAGDRVLGLSSLSFDLSVWDIFGVLGVGGVLVLPEPSAHRDPARWWELAREHHVTVWNSVPALARMFADYDVPGTAGLRLVLLSGDWIPLDLPGRLRAVAPDCRVVSLGGATEAAIWSIHYDIGDVDPAWESIPYGWPLRNQRWHVCDERGQECPAHVTGELFIAGAGLADGYFGDERRTAAAFVTHDGERRYRTGDLGRRRPDGSIEFLGREDFQVKVGGHRIELGEIESALLDHPAVRSAVVTATGDRHHRGLAACVVARPDDGPRGGRAIAPEFFDDADREQMIFDELDRVDFKVARHGVRTDLAGEPVALAADDAADNEVPTRASHRRYADQPVALDDLAALLATLRSHDGAAMAKYAYASAGNAYAVQTYVYVRRVDGLAAGMYYHDPAGHRLVPTSTDPRLAVSFGIDQTAVETAGFVLFLVAAMPAIQPLYGRARARDLCLIEVGLMSQLLETAAPDHRIGLCQVSVVDGADAVLPACGLDELHEVLHAVLGGGLLTEGATPAEANQRPLVAELRTHLAERLPDYMVPPRIVVTDRIPLTSIGKVDRTAVGRLVEHDATRVDASPPATELEARIAQVFGEVLGRSTVGAHARFFDLGADSTMIVRIYRLLKAELDRAFPLTAMFEHPTVHRLATALTATDPAGGGDGGGDRAELLGSARRRAALATAARRRRAPHQSPSPEGAAR